MDKLTRLHSLTVGSNCFSEVYGSGEYRDIGEFEAPDLDDGSGCINPISARETLLLKLSITFRMFNLLRGEHSCQRVRDICSELVNEHEIIGKLIGCLESHDQCVAFGASKAAAAVIMAIPPCMVSRVKLQNLFLGGSRLPWKAIYAADLVRQVIHSYHSNINLKKGIGKEACGCTSTSQYFCNYKKHVKNEVMELCLIQHWETILPMYVPLWREIYDGYKCTLVSARGLKESAVEWLELHVKFSSSFHQNLVKCYHDNISPSEEHKFVAFLKLLLELVEWKQCISGKDQSTCEHQSEELLAKDLKSRKVEVWNQCSNKALESGTDKSRILLRVIPTFAHYLHLKNTSPEVWVNILDLLGAILSHNGLSSKRITDSNAMNVITLECASAFIGVIKCCGLSNIPYDSGFIGFGGADVLTANREESSSGPNSVVLRKVSMLLLKALIEVVNSFEGTDYSMDKLQVVFSCLASWVTKLQDRRPFSRLSSHGTYSELLFGLFSDQDDEMVGMMLLLLKLYRILQRNLINKDSHCFLVSNFNPHSLFLAFLDTVHFDHSVLLDFLISSETTFLTYLVEYLHFAFDDWTGFCSTLGNSDQAVYMDFEGEGLETKHAQESRLSNISLTEFRAENVKKISPVLDGLLAGQSYADDSGTSSCRKALPVITSAFGGIMLAYSDSDEDADGNTGDDTADSRSGDTCDVNCVSVSGIISSKNTFCDPEIGSGHNSGENLDMDNEKQYCKKSIDSDVTTSHFDNACTDDTYMFHSRDKRCGSIYDDGDDDGDSACGVGTSNDAAADEVDDDVVGDDDVVDYDDDNDSAHGVGTCKGADDDDEVGDGDDDDDDFDVGASNTDDDHNQGVFTQFSPLIEKTMSTLIHLRLATERLERAGLFPYKVGPLVRLIERMENLYDGC